ncbi:phosphoribosyl-AMP cyclohydrolase (PRA-CH) [Streptococcus varani]|uniref:Phosphoribosyl-AMP cyclohydrolase n=1 Tax=Streptococcus varani TaxID=1608583 RepID=A0A0E3WF94_9STRE|nr:phosphoribosyl-AMP cyclohydrolase [Streptococcus varani]CQR25107.1 phosphoribosyl-AMP cyclohydrolase (PRA-CH) [Streptococcus varani]
MTKIKLDFDKQGGLIPVIVTDYQTGQVLMLAYMNEESYQLTLETKTMHYWSRSRNEVWHKGATSGHYQQVKSIKTDCDLDTLLISVEQMGAACHTGEYSCFLNRILE